MLNIFFVNERDVSSLNAIKALFVEYQQYLGIPLDFQNFTQELDGLPGKYAAPSGGLYLALYEGRPAGCVAFYQMQPDICELKRLYVKPEFQGKAIGKALITKAMQEACQKGYRHMRLDSLKRLNMAEQLYKRLGFYPISPYNENPHDDVYYMECDLTQVLGNISVPQRV